MRDKTIAVKCLQSIIAELERIDRYSSRLVGYIINKYEGKQFYSGHHLSNYNFPDGSVLYCSHIRNEMHNAGFFAFGMQEYRVSHPCMYELAKMQGSWNDYSDEYAKPRV